MMFTLLIVVASVFFTLCVVQFGLISSRRDKLNFVAEEMKKLSERLYEHQYSERAHVGFPEFSYPLVQSQRNSWIKRLRKCIEVDEDIEKREREIELSKMPDSLVQARCAELRKKSSRKDPQNARRKRTRQRAQ